MTNAARDLFLLSTIAYKRGQIDQAGVLFATAMASADADAFIEELNNNATVSVSASNADRVHSFAAGAFSVIQEDDVTGLPALCAEDEDDDEDFESDDPNPLMPGQNILPSAISASTVIKMEPTLKCPITIVG